MTISEYKRNPYEKTGWGNTHHEHPCIKMRCGFYKNQKCADKDPRFSEICRYSKYWDKHHEKKH